MWRLPPPNALSPAALKLRAQTTINSRGRTDLAFTAALLPATVAFGQTAAPGFGKAGQFAISGDRGTWGQRSRQRC